MVCWWSDNTEKKYGKREKKRKGRKRRIKKRKKERGEFNLKDPLFLLISISFFQKIIK